MKGLKKMLRRVCDWFLRRPRGFSIVPGAGPIVRSEVFAVTLLRCHGKAHVWRWRHLDFNAFLPSLAARIVDGEVCVDCAARLVGQIAKRERIDLRHRGRLCARLFQLVNELEAQRS